MGAAHGGGAAGGMGAAHGGGAAGGMGAGGMGAGGMGAGIPPTTPTRYNNKLDVVVVEYVKLPLDDLVF